MQHLILLHGAIGAKDQLQPLADSLESNYTVHTLNFNGHGGEPFASEGFSIPQFAGEVAMYMQQNEINKANIFGYSMGGYVALYLARHQPVLVNKIVTLATKLYWDEAVAAKEVKMLDAAIIQQKVPAFAAQLEKRHLPNDWKIVLEKTAAMLLQLGKQNALQPDDYTYINNPCLLLLGENDKMVSVAETATVAEALPQAAFKWLPDTPHPLEQVDLIFLSSLITDFMG